MLGIALQLLPCSLQTWLQYKLLWWCKLWDYRTFYKFFSEALTNLVRFQGFSFFPPSPSINLFTCTFYRHLGSANDCVRPWIQRWIELSVSLGLEEERVKHINKRLWVLRTTVMWTVSHGGPQDEELQECLSKEVTLEWNLQSYTGVCLTDETEESRGEQNGLTEEVKFFQNHRGRHENTKADPEEDKHACEEHSVEWGATEGSSVGELQRTFGVHPALPCSWGTPLTSPWNESRRNEIFSQDLMTLPPWPPWLVCRWRTDQQCTIHRTSAPLPQWLPRGLVHSYTGRLRGGILYLILRKLGTQGCAARGHSPTW